MGRRVVGCLLAMAGIAIATVSLADTVGERSDQEGAAPRSFASRGLGLAIGAGDFETRLELAQASAKPQPESPLPPATTAPPATPQTVPTPGSWPKTLPEAKAEAEARANPQAVTSTWPQQDIDNAKARCTAILKGLDVVTIPEPPMREGDCGAPAPVRLVSIGRDPEVALSPPPVVTCDMVVSLHTWMRSDIQPLARKHLGAPVIKIETMSDYACRNAYGRAKSRLSEHGKANALDIRGFTTAKGETAMLLADWGLTARDIAAQVAAAKAAAEKAAREKAAVEAAAIAARKELSRPSSEAPASAAAATGTTGAVSSGIALRDGGATLVEGLPRVMLTIPGIAPAQEHPRDAQRAGAAFGAEPARLGGPGAVTGQMTGQTGAKATVAPPQAAKSAAAPAVDGQRVPITHAPASSRDQTSAKARFLREAHAAGCRTFGTTLGPEANNAHRNHFHVDMAERKTSNYCE